MTEENTGESYFTLKTKTFRSLIWKGLNNDDYQGRVKEALRRSREKSKELK